MKKTVTLVLAFALALSLSACGAGNEKSQGDASGAQEAGDQFALADDENSIYGKIVNITGNEIEIAVAEKPVDDDSGRDELSGEVITPNGNNMPVVGAEIADTTDDLKFTGEVKTLTIPAGVKITAQGEETSLSSLKKGDIVSVSVDPQDFGAVAALDKVK